MEDTADSALADYAEPLIQAKQALKDYEQAVLHGKWQDAHKEAVDIEIMARVLSKFAWINWSKRDSQP